MDIYINKDAFIDKTVKSLVDKGIPSIRAYSIAMDRYEQLNQNKTIIKLIKK